MKRFARICMLLLTLVLTFSAVATAYAAGSVTYDGDANLFIFKPGTEDSPTNLFENLQGVMPGDVCTDQITIKNDTSKRVKIKVYLRSKGAQEGTEDFLSQLNLTVKQKEKTVLFDAPADQTAQLTEWTYLGTIYPRGKITLNLTLDVPIELDDDFQNVAGYIDWEFKVVEIPYTDNGPATGDQANVLFYAGLMVVSFMILMLILLAKKRKKCEEQCD